MRFKRPQVRYAESPQPATPYQSAEQVWDERIGSARVQAKNWRLMAFGCLALALLMAGGLVWRSAQSIVTPYVVEVDHGGQVRAVGEAATPYRPNDAQTAHHLARFITLVRSLSIDPIVVRQNWLDAYDYTTDRGAAVLNDYARANDPFARIGRETVTVQINSVVRASDTSFNVRWTERRYVNGAAAGLERWTAVVSVVLQTPRTEERLRRNPLGIYVNGLSWSRQASSCETILTQDEWRVLWLCSERAPLPSSAPPARWASLAVARLGGFADTKRTGRPGWDAYWHGWARLQERLTGYQLARRLAQQM